MKRFSSLRVRLVGMVFVVIAPVFVWLFYHRHEDIWPSFLMGLGALAAAWLGGEFFILRQVRTITLATQKLSQGDLASRTGLTGERTELGDLARSIDQMAATLQQQILDREKSEQSLLDRAHQLTVVAAALGQFATHHLRICPRSSTRPRCSSRKPCSSNIAPSSNRLRMDARF